MKRLASLLIALTLALGFALGIHSPTTGEANDAPLTAVEESMTSLKEESASTPAHRTRPSRIRRGQSELRLGDQRTWKVDAVHDVDFGSAAGQSLETTAAGTWEMTFVEKSETLERHQIRFRDVVFSVGSGGRDALNPGMRRAAEAEFQTPFFVSLDSEGRAQTFHFEPNVSAPVRNQLKSLMSAAQVVGARTDEERWSHEESDPMGEFLATYTRHTDGTIRRQKERYLRTPSPAGMQPVVEGMITIDESEGRITLDALGGLVKLDATTIVSVAPGMGMAAIRTTSRVAFERIATARAPHLVGLFSDAYRSLEVEAMAAYTGDERGELRAHDERLLKGADYTVIESALTRIAQSPEDRALRSETMVKAQALFRLEPRAALRAGSTVRSLDDAHATQVLIGALGGAGTEEAQAVLRDFAFGGELDLDGQVQAIAALGMTDAPTAETLEALTEGIASADEDVSNTSALALGNAVNELNEQGELSETEDPIATLIALFESAQTMEEQILALKALGNSGDLRAMPTIQSVLTTGGAAIRGAAVDALRFMPDATADALIAQTMLQDPSYGVRRDAITAASYREVLVHLASLTQVLQADPSAIVRTDAVEVLGQKILEVPEVVTALTWAAENDSEITIQNKASQFLALPAQMAGAL